MSANNFSGFLTVRPGPDVQTADVRQKVDFDMIGRRVVSELDHSGPLVRDVLTARIADAAKAAAPDVKATIDYLTKIEMVKVGEADTLQLTDYARHALTAFSFR